jgi:hypothetical protein
MLFQPILFIEVATFCCSVIFFLFHMVNKLKRKDITLTPDEYQSKVRDMKLDDILNGTHKATKSTINGVKERAINKHFLVPYCGWISFINLILFITITYLEVKHYI